MTTVAVTGATGQLGRLILAARGDHDVAIIAFARDADRARGLVGPNVAVRVGDYNDPAGLETALADVDRLVFISGTEVGRRLQQHHNVVEAARRADVRHILYTSAPHADNTTLPVAPDHKATEEMIIGSRLTYTLLRNNWYHENYAAQIGPAAGSGELIGSAGDGRVASAARPDYAAAAAAVAVGSGYENRTYELAGDVAWSMDDLAAAISGITGSPVRYRNLATAEHVGALLAAGLDEPTAQFVTAMDTAIARGALADNSTGDLRRLIERPTTPLAEGLRAAMSDDANG